MAELINGYTWEDSEQVTYLKLNAQFSEGGVRRVTQADCTAGVVTVQGDPPSGKQGDLWFDTSLGSGRGFLRMNDGSDWRHVGEGSMAYNLSGTTIGVGAPVKYDSTQDVSTGLRTPVTKTTAISDRILGIAVTEIANGEVGIVLTRGRCKAIKNAATCTKGEGFGPSTANGQITTLDVGGWGDSQGMGFFLETSSGDAGTLVEVYLVGQTNATYMACKSSPTLVGTFAAPTNDSWANRGQWSVRPSGTTSHLVKVVMNSVPTTPAQAITIGIRAYGTTVTLDSGAPGFQTYMVTNDGVKGQLWVSGDTATYEMYFKSSIGTNTNMTVTLWEDSVMLGGHVV